MIKRIGKALAVVVVALLLIVAALHFIGQSRLNTAPAVPSHVVALPSDGEAIARGDDLATISSCKGCHGSDLGGAAFIDEAPIGYLPAPNLTRGDGGIGGRYTVEDWERAIRHGVAQDGRTLAAMPSNAFSRYSDEELGALIAYLQQLPPVDRLLDARAIAFPGTILFGFLGSGDLPVNLIDQQAPHAQAAPRAEVSASYGEHLVTVASCQSCHGPALDGVVNPGEPQGPNITQGGELAEWSEAEFIAALQQGQRPDGRPLDPEMPWAAYARMSESDAKAIWAYLQSVPAATP
ncbi:MAG: cytochrome c [Anaerolineales bacterium]|nr:cytochrome c [Anaerolineales bacterium]MCB9126720.1 cytochrome c [Ardenticatenales bacterium]MCB9171738.1 cytochrome c [Ardenticatenales bacterium]